MNKSKGKNLVKLPPGPPQRHGGYSFISTGRLPRHRRYLLRYLSGCRAGMVRDLGPTEQDLSTAQVILIDRAIGKIGLLRCMEESARETGVMHGHHLMPALKASYLAYSNSLRLDLQALGLDKRKADDSVDLQSYIKAFDKTQARTEARQRRKAKALDSVEIVQPERAGEAVFSGETGDKQENEEKGPIVEEGK